MIYRLLLALGLLLGPTGAAIAQGVADPLLFQGMDQTVWPGARARAMGGVVMGDYRDATALFADPAALTRLKRAEVRIGGSYSATSLDQEVRWIPDRIYAELSLVLENDPDKLVQIRPFDSIRPDWDHSYTATRPAVAAMAFPFAALGASWTAGLGYGQVAVLDHYYQNNNALDPNIGRMRPAPVPRVQEGDSLLVDWFQFARERKGALYGITPALAVRYGRLAFGLSVTVLTGSSDDWQRRFGRGLFILRYNNDFSLLPPRIGEEITEASSDYRGVRTTISGRLEYERFAVGVVLRPGYTLERRWETQAGNTGTDKLEVPTQMTVGLALYPSRVWRLVADYDLRRQDEVRYIPAGSDAQTPWVGKGTFRLGAEFLAADWLALRAGYRDEPQSFAPAGAAFIDDPAIASVYTAGVGIMRGPFVVDLTYELFRLRYDDLWISNVNTNRMKRHTLLLEVAYRF